MAKRKLLQQVYDKTNGRCWYCGTSHRPFDEWQIEHQIPRIRGGTDDIANLVLACQSCNLAKGKRTVQEYRIHIIARLENVISSAREVVDEIESVVGWERRDDGGLDGVMYPPLWLMEVDSLLQATVEKTIYVGPIFYGEKIGVIAEESHIDSVVTSELNT